METLVSMSKVQSGMVFTGERGRSHCKSLCNSTDPTGGKVLYQVELAFISQGNRRDENRRLTSLPMDGSRTASIMVGGGGY